MRREAFLPIALCLIVVGCVRSGDLEVVDSWARPNPVASDTAAIYITVANHGEEDALVGASAERCGSAMLHSTVMTDNVMQMQEIASVEVPEGSAVVMQPGGIHIMCMGLDSPFVAGDTVLVTLSFSKHGGIEVEVPVEDR